MNTRSLLLCASVLLLLINVTAPEVDAQTAAPAIDPKATELLKQMGGYLNGLNSFSVHVQTMKDLMLPSDEALSSSNAFDLMVERPNKFRINMTSAARRRILRAGLSRLQRGLPERSRPSVAAIRSIHPSNAIARRDGYHYLIIGGAPRHCEIGRHHRDFAA